jgi:hypothetical protein
MVFGRKRSGPATGGAAPAARRFRPAVESLEDRTVPTVTYHGGAVLPHVEVEAVYLGSNWQTDPSLAALPGQLGGFLQSVTHSSYLALLGQAGYRVGTGSYVGAGTDAVPLGWAVSDGRIQGELAASILNGSVPPPDANRLYVVYVEPNVVVTSPFGSSAVDLLGYHSDFQGPTGTPVSYAVLPYPAGVNGGVPGLSTFEALTSITSHELAESVTDPQGVNVGRPGWFDATWRDPASGQTGAEIADMTQGVLIDLNGYVVQAAVNKKRHLLLPPDGAIDPRSTGLPHQAHASRRHHASHHVAHHAAEALANPTARQPVPSALS